MKKVFIIAALLTTLTGTACAAEAESAASAAEQKKKTKTDKATTPDACAQTCINQNNACSVAPGANLAQCASDFAACLGYNPYNPSYVEPTSCAKSNP